MARKNLRAMKEGDLCFFYHSSAGKNTGIAGLVSVLREAYEDPLDAKWSVVDVEHRETWQPVLSLEAIKAHAAAEGGTLDGLILLRQPRLSVQPVSEPHFRVLSALYHEQQESHSAQGEGTAGGGAAAGVDTSGARAAATTKRRKIKEQFNSRAERTGGGFDSERI